MKYFLYLYNIMFFPSQYIIYYYMYKFNIKCQHFVQHFNLTFQRAIS